MKKNDLEEPLPESSPLRLRKRRRKYPVPLFRGNSYFPTPVPPILTFSSTVFPRYKTISEVYYKDEIQPNEQLNVFADVMNNIKKTQNDLVGADTEFVEDRNVSFNTANKKNNVKIKVPLRKIKIRQSTVNNLPEISTTTTTTTTEKLQTRRRNNFRNHKPDSQVFEEYINTIKDVKDNVQKPLNVKNNYILDKSKLEDVIGLSPPTIERSTIVPSHVQSQKVILNTFPVTGMKPPISYRPLYPGVINSKQKNRIRRKNYFHIVHKRSAEKRVYSEIRRNKPQQPDVLDDDYTPNRNRNFHYDTKTKQVVYTNPEPETKEEQIEENSYEDTTDKIPFFEPSTTTTTTEAGPSFLDYIQQVKTHKRYQYITEPTEKPKESTTQQHTTVPVSSDTPDFLKFVSKLKQNEGYVVITEKSKTKTTTQPPKIDNEDSHELQIFDITEYLPKQESYVPSVTIDYSKYKTIQRKPIDNSKIVLEEDNDTSAVRDDFTEQSTLSKVTTTEAEPTTRKQRLRTRRPLSKTRYTEATTTSTTVIPSRSTKRRFRSTTQATTEIFQETYNQTQRPVRRRLTTRSLKPSQVVPPNHKEVDTPINDTRKHKRLRLSSYTNKDEETSTLDQSIVDEPENKSLDSYETRSDKETRQNLDEVSLKNIKIIKDPSKRSYYYVPVK
ncbi:hypothetical protein RN001_014116 [Aquatica leii]|uniref:Uncharacterized protein n=1 Tax=Aquatica leii TaxID=1421715 RepID=A0AAN7S7C6_9COLE|nr:hypothetical protein RN001_014116 [Aquatica leii]